MSFDKKSNKWDEDGDARPTRKYRNLCDFCGYVPETVKKIVICSYHREQYYPSEDIKDTKKGRRDDR